MSKKKIIIIVAASVAAAAVLIAGITLMITSLFKSGSNSSKATLTVGTVSGAVGQNVKVPVKFTDNPGAMGFQLYFDYNSDSLEYISFEKGELLTDCEISDKNGKLTLISVEDKDVKKDGTLVYLTFKVKDGATGSCDINITAENGVCNFDEQIIPVKTVNGKINIK